MSLEFCDSFTSTDVSPEFISMIENISAELCCDNVQSDISITFSDCPIATRLCVDHVVCETIVEETPVDESQMPVVRIATAYSNVDLFISDLDRTELIKALYNRYTKAEADERFVQKTEYYGITIFHYNTQENPYNQMKQLWNKHLVSFVEYNGEWFVVTNHYNEKMYYCGIHNKHEFVITVDRVSGYAVVERSYYDTSELFTKTESDARFRFKTDKPIKKYIYNNSLISKFDEISTYFEQGEVVIVENVLDTGEIEVYGLANVTDSQMLFVTYKEESVKHFRLVEGEQYPRSIITHSVPNEPQYFIYSQTLSQDFYTIKQKILNGDQVFIIDISNNGRIAYTFSNFVKENDEITGVVFSNICNNQIITVKTTEVTIGYHSFYNTIIGRLDALDETTEDHEDRIDEIEENYLTIETLPIYSGNISVLGEGLLGEMVLGDF